MSEERPFNVITHLLRITETLSEKPLPVDAFHKGSFSIFSENNYRKTSSTSRTKSQSLNVSCILVQLFSLNPLKPGVKLRMKM